MMAMLESMYSNIVWNIVGAPKGIKQIRCKWDYKRKRWANENV